jgi:hypothetical protein
MNALTPWVDRPDKIIQFFTDEGALYCSQHHHLSAASPVPDRLEIKAPPHGTVIVTGPLARELCGCLCAGHATLIRADGTEILSVTLQMDQVAL